MRRREALLGLVLCVFAVSGLCATTAYAATLKISPLRYDAALVEGEKKKGFVDISNPTSTAVKVRFSVQAFRQTDDNGSLEFYDNEAVQAGVLLDLKEAEIGPREALHLAFVLDGSRLPTGDVFAAIFAATEPSIKAPAEQSVRVGALIMLSNMTPSKHVASVSSLSVPLFQFGDGLLFHFDVHNDTDSGQATGFSPEVNISAWPYVEEKTTGPLVFAGRTRTVEYVKNGNYLGIIQVKIGSGSSEKTAYSVVVTGNWRYLLPIILLSGVAALILVRRFGRHLSGAKHTQKG